MHTFNATGLTYFFKTLDNYGNQLQDPNYTANVMHTIVENNSYEMLREDLKYIISSISINNLNQVYQIYKRYSELTEEKFPYDLSSLNTLNEITKKTYINEYNYPIKMLEQDKNPSKLREIFLLSITQTVNYINQHRNHFAPLTHHDYLVQ